jgi:cell wall-associated NlpC family hydrolase/L,D-peptidoglycan transpeptidase YkuD (ErfK/YbiS/YcfS/YnhG family)
VLRLRHSIVAGVAVVAALTALAAGQATPAVARAAGMAIPWSANQLIVVSSPTDDPPDYLATLRVYERANRTSPWRIVFGPWQAETGSGHLLSAGARREGDHATPVGVFGIGGTMYGNEPNPGGLHYGYHRLGCGDWWDEDPHSPQYNRFVHVPCGVTPSFASWSEPLWTETVAYPYFAVIRFNINPTRSGANALGSGIFLHSWVGGATEGCVALREWQLLDVLRWLKPSAHPVIEIGTEGQVRAPAAGSDRPLLSTSTPASTRYVDVSVATVWSSPSAPRTIDRPALGNPVNIGAWSRALNTAARLGLDGKIETQALFGEPVRIVARRGSWTRVAVVDQPAPIDRVGYPGWVPTRQLIAGANFGGLLAGPTAVVDVPTAVLRGAVRPLELSFGTRLPVLGVSGNDVQVATPDGRVGELPRSAVDMSRPGAASPVPTGEELVATARLFLGVRYLWGGTSAFGFDCSGLVNLVYRERGMVIPRDADAQALTGRPVAKDALEPGDLVFFATDPPSPTVSHVGMYIGDGQMIEAPNSASAVHVIPLAAFGDEYVSARRYVPTG